MGVEPYIGFHARLQITNVLLVHLGDDLALRAADAANLRLGRHEFTQVAVTAQNHPVHRRRGNGIVLQLVLHGIPRPLGILHIVIQGQLFLLHLIAQALHQNLLLLVFDG